jgi:hypothetical protein
VPIEGVGILVLRVNLQQDTIRLRIESTADARSAGPRSLVSQQLRGQRFQLVSGILHLRVFDSERGATAAADTRPRAC